MIELEKARLNPKEAVLKAMRGCGICGSMEENMKNLGHPELRCNYSYWHDKCIATHGSTCCAYVIAGTGRLCYTEKSCETCDEYCEAIRILIEEGE